MKGFPLKKWWTVQQAATDPNLSDSAFRLLIRLINHHNNKTGQCNPTQSLLASDLNRSERTIRSGLRELEKFEFVKTRSIGKVPSRNAYELRFFEGDERDFYEAEKCFRQRRKESSDKQKKEHKKKKGRENNSQQVVKAAAKYECFGRIKTRQILEKELAKKLGGNQLAWQATTSVPQDDFERVVDSLQAKKLTYLGAVGELLKLVDVS